MNIGCVGYFFGLSGVRYGLLTTGAAFLLSVGAGSVTGQERPWSVDVEIGAAFAGGEFGNYVQSGPSGSLRVARDVWAGMAWFAEAGVDQFRGREVLHHVAWGPDTRKVRFAVGLERDLVPADLEGYEALSLRVRLGAGVASFKSDDFRYVEGTEDLVFETTAPMAVLGLALGYEVREGVSLFMSAGLNWVVIKEEDTTDLAGLAPTFAHPFDTAGTFPYGVGVSMSF